MTRYSATTHSAVRKTARRILDAKDVFFRMINFSLSMHYTPRSGLDQTPFRCGSRKNDPSAVMQLTRLTTQ